MKMIEIERTSVRLSLEPSHHYDLKQWDKIDFHCFDAAGIEIRVDKHEKGWMEEYKDETKREHDALMLEYQEFGTVNGRRRPSAPTKRATLFSISSTDSLESVIDKKAMMERGGYTKATIFMRAYRIELTKLLVAEHGVKHVPRNLVYRALRMSGGNFNKAYNDLATNVFTELKIVMDDHYFVKYYVRDSLRHIKYLEGHVMKLKSTPKTDRHLIFKSVTALGEEKKQLAIAQERLSQLAPTAKMVLEKYFCKLEEEFRGRGKKVITRGEMIQCLESAKCDYPKAVSRAMRFEGLKQRGYFYGIHW